MVFYPGGTEEQYRAVIDEIGPAHSEAPGRQFLAAGATEGGWLMVMVWESQDDFQRWAAEHVGPAHERVGARGWQSPPEITDFTPYHVLT
jgi:heme-degrading monooxygenase HmoA